MAKPLHISSNWTLFLKIFFPIFWCVFFGAITIAFWFNQEIHVGGGMSGRDVRLLMTSFLLTGAALFYFTTVQLKRVEVDDVFVYVTNYKKTARYPFHNIEKLEEVNYFIFKIIRLYFRKPGMFGKKIIFLANQQKLEAILNKHKELAVLLDKEI